MGFEYESEKREFVRIKIDVPVRFKYLSSTETLEDDRVHEAITRNLSGSGILLVTKLPPESYVVPLLEERIFIGMNLLLPSKEDPIKALARVAWIESVDQKSGKCGLGLKFREITQESQDEIFKYIIRAQIG